MDGGFFRACLYQNGYGVITRLTVVSMSTHMMHTTLPSQMQTKCVTIHSHSQQARVVLCQLSVRCFTRLTPLFPAAHLDLVYFLLLVGLYTEHLDGHPTPGRQASATSRGFP